MADYNYSNPGGLAPSIGYQPQGFLGGVAYGNREQEFEKAMAQQRAMQNLSILQKGAEYQDYLASGPVREAKRGLDISTFNAQAPIQGALAGAQRAQAEGVTQTQPSLTAANIAKNKEMKMAYAEERVSNALDSLIQAYNRDPLATGDPQSRWTNDIVPELEREIGEPMPQSFKIMDINSMMMHNQRLLGNRENRRAMLAQAAKDAAALEREHVQGQYRVDTARQRGDNTTAAEARVQQQQQYAQTLEQVFLQRGMDPAQARQRALIESAQLFWGGNVPERGAQQLQQDYFNQTNRLEAIDRLRADQRPPINVSRPNPDAVVGQVYRTEDGRYVRIVQDQRGKGFIVLQPPQGSLPPR